MAIEVKQLLVKSTVLQRPSTASNNNDRNLSHSMDELRENILAECRHLIMDVLREQQER